MLHRSDYDIVKKVDMCNRSLFVYGKKNQSTSVSVYNNFKTVIRFYLKIKKSI